MAEGTYEVRVNLGNGGMSTTVEVKAPNSTIAKQIAEAQTGGTVRGMNQK